MASVNIAIVVGYVGNEPRVSSTQSGRKVASFPLATTEAGYTAQNGNQVPERTEWHNIVCWGKTAEIVERFVHKGSSLYVQGKNRTRSYDGNDGQKRYVTEIECEVLQMLDRRADGSQPQGQNQAASAHAPQNQSRNPFPPAQPSSGGGSDDDLPF